MRDLVGVDGVEFRFLGDQLRLHFAGQVVPDFIFCERTVEQEHAAWHQRAEHVVALEENPLMAGDEVRLGDQVAGMDRLRPEAQVRDRHRAGFLGVVDEVSLRIVVGVFADDLDGVLVGADRAVRAQAVKQGAHNAVGLGGERCVVVEAGVADVVVNADGEVIFRLGLLQVVVDGLHHGRREFLGGQTIAAADDGGAADAFVRLSFVARPPDECVRGSMDECVRDSIAFADALVNCVDYVEVERFADRAGFFGAIENCDLADSLGEGFHERLHAEGTVQADFQQADFFSARVQVLDRFVRGFCAGAHHHDHTVSVGRADVVEEVILASYDSQRTCSSRPAPWPEQTS